MNILEKIFDTLHINFNFLNRHNSPSTKLNISLNGPLKLSSEGLHTQKAKYAAADLWESVVSNMREAPFVIGQGINRKWLSDEILNTRTKFEKYRIHFPTSLKEAFEKWFYAFQTAFRTQDLFETNKAKDILENEIQKILENKNDY